MEEEEVLKPSKREWKRCLDEVPLACKDVTNLLCGEERVLGTRCGLWRRKIDKVRQQTDELSSRCHAFNLCHRRHGRLPKFEQLPCQQLRRRIMVKRLHGAWLDRTP